MKKMYRFLRKYHKWSGIILTLFLILFSVSGIILNHRQTFAKISIDRKHLHKAYRYNKWNIASVKEMYKLSPDSVFAYGNIGIWLTDSTLSQFEDFNAGFPEGVDYRKAFKILRYDNQLYAGMLYGFYRYDSNAREWKMIELPIREKNVVDMAVDDGEMLVMTRSHMLKTKDGKHFEEIKLPPPEGFDNKVGLFKTLWVIHSGEIYGRIGILVVDLIAIITIFLSVTGIILYISKENIKRHKSNPVAKKKNLKQYRWNIKWHNKIGWTTAILLIITTTTGIFLRPPLLAAIFKTNVAKIPYTELDTPNPWYDILRRIIYLPENDIHVISTYDAFYYSPDEFKTMIKFEEQPPASVMGVTVLEDLGKDKLLIGSFEGLFEWNFQTGHVFDAIKKVDYVKPEKAGPPVGDYKVSGYGFNTDGDKILFDYEFGALGVDKKVHFPEMPENILKESPMSLWGLSLEIHTGRIYTPILGIFYVLVVPLVGLFAIFCIVAGFVIWYRYYRKTGRKTKARR